ncbi:MAG TPA: HEAT repeat domain-containing protein [Chloroflexota bacterium]|nr:HEAT repeat domain-containing protein [Chloroflexota bacterium]
MPVQPDVAALIEALSSGRPGRRKAVAFHLRAYGERPETVAALVRAALHDPEPKVRRNAAISLGKIGAPAALPAVSGLARALETEAFPWVRRSVILALGAIGGAAAQRALQALAPQDTAEGEARRAAVARGLPSARVSGWRGCEAGASHLLRLWLDVPVGLEDVAAAEAAGYGLPGVASGGPGLLRCAPGTAPWAVFPTMRCVYRLLVEAGQGRPLDLASGASAHLAEQVSRSEALRQLHRWLETAGGVDGPIPYRLSMERPRVPREVVRTLAAAVREPCRRLGLVENPSRYDLQLVVRSDGRGCRLFVEPSFVQDDRFAYRRRDVGAALNPVVAAALARLACGVGAGGGAVRDGRQITIFDPTCGSGTLLIECARLAPGARLLGLDISPTAVAAARQNVATAGLAERIEVRRGDATDAGAWPACDLVVANLPFGIRTGQRGADPSRLPRLYQGVIDNLGRRVRQGGAALLYSTQARRLEACLNRGGVDRWTIRRRHLEVGGLRPRTWLLSRPEEEFSTGLTCSCP